MIVKDLGLPGPSSLGRVWRCIASEALEHFENAPHEYTKLGDIMHEFLERAYNDNREAALEWAYAEHRHLLDALELVPFEMLPPPGEGIYQAEVSIAYHVRSGTARILGKGLNRNEARALAKPGEIIGTIDLCALEGDDGVLAIDWKTGWKPVDPAEFNWQIKTYLLMLARALGKTRGRAAIFRVLWNGSVLKPDWVEMDAHEMKLHEVQVRMLMRKRELVLESKAKGEPLPPLVLGDHCEYCPALRACPAHLALVRSNAEIDEVRNLSPEEIGQGYRKLQRRKKALALVEAWYRATAKQSPIELDNGEVLGTKLRRTETILPERAHEALERRFGPGTAEAIIGECVTTVSRFTKKALRKALKDFVLPTLEDKRIGKLEKETLEAMRQSLALTVKESKPVVVFRPGKASEDEETFDEEDDEAA